MIRTTGKMRMPRPLVLAPMAGGPSTVELCAAVCNAGALGFLASAYLTVDALVERLRITEAMTQADFGVNILVPESRQDLGDRDAYNRYRAKLADGALPGGRDLPRYVSAGDDDYPAKVDAAIGSAARYVSFTFGIPDRRVVERLHGVGKSVVLYATSARGIEELLAAGADVVGVQGPKAGGHRATLAGIEREDVAESLLALVGGALAQTDKPIIAAGGVGTPGDLLELLRAGADAVQVGTLFLTANEAGTRSTHRRALLELKDRETLLTRAFSGRCARTISNHFARSYNDSAPALYPEVHFLTAPIREHADKVGDPEHLNLWAGTGFRHCQTTSAERLVTELTPYSRGWGTEWTQRADDHDVGRLAVVGGGPRGLAVIERVASQLTDNRDTRLLIDWYDDTAVASGRVWSPYQSASLLMNTVASQLSAFPDSSSGFGDKYIPGPTFFEWLESPESTIWLERDPVLLAKRRSMTGNSYAPRPLYGTYLCWAAHFIETQAPESVAITYRRERVTRIETIYDSDRELRALTTDAGTNAAYDAVVLAVGHLPSAASPAQMRLQAKAHKTGAVYVPPSDASVRQGAQLRRCATVILRGLGLTFFDYLELLTSGRGGVYALGADGRLTYQPSGREPLIYGCSRHGVPYHARGRNEKEPSERWRPRFLTPEYIADLRRRRADGTSITFARHVWPMITREVELAFALSQLQGSADENERALVVALAADDPTRLRDLRKSLDIEPAAGFSWHEVIAPKIAIDGIATLAEYQVKVLAHLETDILRASGGNKSDPFKAALDVLRDIRNEVRLAVQNGLIDDWSFSCELTSFYTPFNSFVSIGPPTYRVEQLCAAIRAGTVQILPPDPFIVAADDAPAFHVIGKYLSREHLRADALVEARQPVTDVLTTTDQLVRDLIDTRSYAVHRFDDTAMPSGAALVDRGTFALTKWAGEADNRVYLYGIQIEGMHWGTAATIRPYVNSVIFQEADQIASQVIQRARRPKPSVVGANVREHGQAGRGNENAEWRK